ncbi:MAG TPA: hypothetical protein VLD63_15065 [Anaerolineales bacterium]|nr:hypothetical protein [Anaerolineales bacterium]
MVWPAVLALAVSAAFAGIRLGRSGWDAEALANMGTRFSEGDPAGSEGYDGQFTLYVARDPNPETVAAHLDRPAYRYQRILLPLIARLVVLGDAQAIPWALLAIGLLAQFSGTLAVAALMDRHSKWPGYALGYGLWVGVVVGVGLFLHEPLAYGLVAGGWSLRAWGRRPLGNALLVLALFAKETTIVFAGAALIEDLLQRSASGRAAAWLAGGILAWLAWQAWLWRTFGEVGLGSGGAQGTPFEWIPLMGLIRVGFVDVRVFLLYLVIFGPTMVLPAIWAAWMGVRDLVRKVVTADGLALLLNGCLILFLPFSSFREPLAILRLGSGVVLATLAYAAANNQRRSLNYAMFWTALLVVLLNG